MNFLVAVEGGEYVGKTTIVAPSLEKIFTSLGWVVKIGREPGGTKKGEEIRKKIFEQAREKAPAEELALLFNQSRKIHIDDVIKPFFKENTGKNSLFILDRYLDSTRVYQGFEGGVDFDTIRKLEAEYVRGFFPHLTFILYIPEDKFNEIMRQRIASSQKGRERSPWEDFDFSVQLQRQRYYLSLPELSKTWGEKRSFAIIDASQSSEKVVKDCLVVFENMVKLQKI